MPKLTATFEYLPDLDSVEADNLAKWLNYKGDTTVLENRLGNRIYYSQAVPITLEDLEFDLALLREVLKLHPQKYYNQASKKIIIPKNLLNNFPDLTKVVWAFIDALQPLGLTTLILSSETGINRNLGTLLKPEASEEGSEINLWVGNNKYQVKIGSLMVLPASEYKVGIKFASEKARLLGKKELQAEITGGNLGLMVDARVFPERSG